MGAPGCSLTRPNRLQRHHPTYRPSPLNSFTFCIYRNPLKPRLQPLCHLHLQTPPPLSPLSSAFTKTPGGIPSLSDQKLCPTFQPSNLQTFNIFLCPSRPSDVQPKPFLCHTSKKCTRNSNDCHTSKSKDFKVLYLPHMQKRGGGGQRLTRHSFGEVLRERSAKTPAFSPSGDAWRRFSSMNLRRDTREPSTRRSTGGTGRQRHRTHPGSRSSLLGRTCASPHYEAAPWKACKDSYASATSSR